MTDELPLINVAGFDRLDRGAKGHGGESQSISHDSPNLSNGFDLGHYYYFPNLKELLKGIDFCSLQESVRSGFPTHPLVEA